MKICPNSVTSALLSTVITLGATSAASEIGFTQYDVEIAGVVQSIDAEGTVLLYLDRDHPSALGFTRAVRFRYSGPLKNPVLLRLLYDAEYITCTADQLLIGGDNPNLGVTEVTDCRVVFMPEDAGSDDLEEAYPDRLICEEVCERSIGGESNVCGCD